MKTILHLLRLALALAFTLSPLHAAPPPGILNHQGRIAVSGANYTGTGHFKFALVDAAGTTTLWSNNNSSAGGGQPTVAVPVVVSQGHYALGLGDTALANMTVAIPASVFTGNADVRLRVWFATAVAGPFEQLTPDRRITATGYALTAGAVADPSFVGTTGNTPLDLSVNNQRAFRLQPTTSFLSPLTPNLVGGFSGNSIASEARGAVIAGGGGAGFANTITEGGSFAFLGGGISNTASGFKSVLGGGESNVADGQLATVPGGAANTASGFVSFAAGFRAKAIHTGAFVWADAQSLDFTSTAANQFLIRAAGGVGINKDNPAVALDVNGTVRATAFQGMGAPLLFATTDNQPLDFSVNGLRAFRLQPGNTNGAGTPNLIGGDAANSIEAAAHGSVIAGGGAGGANSVTAFSDNATIGGGKNNTASNNDTVIGGGANNIASGPAATVGGGNTNTASGAFATVPGGQNNTADGFHSFAAGQQAKAIHDGAFVWADSQNAEFASTAVNQFNVRAAGGARLFTGGTGLRLDTDTVVFSGSSQTARFGDAANVDFNPLTSLNGLLIEQGNSESSGIFFDGDSITMWSPGDNGRLFRILDEDAMAGGAVAAERFYVDGTGGIFSAGGASIAGNVSIGTPSSVARLVVTGTLSGDPEASHFQVRAAAGKLFEVFTTSANVTGFCRLGGGTAFKLGGGSWSVESDARLKKNVADLHGSLDRLLRLRSVSFEYLDPAKGVGPGPQIGFIAQEVREVLPQWVTAGPDGMLAVGVTGFESLTVDALRELRAEKDRQIAELKDENTALKQRLDRLERAVAALPPPPAAPVAVLGNQ